MQIIPKMAAVVLLAAIGLPAMAQKIKLVDGDLAALKSEKQLNVEFTYDQLKVGKFDNEADYIQKKTAEYNQKEAGKGDNWAKAWKNDRKDRFEPSFESLFNENSDTKVGDYAGAKYTLIFHTTFVEPGFNVGVMRKNAYIDAEVLIVETANKSKTVAKISVDNAPGRMFGGFDFDTGERIKEAYAVSGKKLARFINK
ncbi:hypothetical protein SAMN04488128_105199 [Chitinophaga eiseniae]|uniref:Uncharacterized protein n=1 Tax=Chitinophaga eiseniae TaxID=634771 RepID=A0A1T4TJ62_9BACT|nr:hypothetical protein [Chitinophaga eiseniae]SKA40487.1 hypothetical protein SAMN04488128_105199 [Chitinophaga eiseniae]